LNNVVESSVVKTSPKILLTTSLSKEAKMHEKCFQKRTQPKQIQFDDAVNAQWVTLDISQQVWTTPQASLT